MASKDPNLNISESHANTFTQEDAPRKHSVSSISIPPETHILQDRTIGTLSAISLVVNKIIGSGIFSTPATIYKQSGSVGMSLILWVLGATIACSGSLVMLEFGSAIPRSGGMKNYLERAVNPSLLATCVYIFYCVFLQVSASNAITFSSYILVAAGAEETTWLLRGCAIASVAFACFTHAVAPRVGRAIQDAMGAIKIFTLFFIVCCGFAALAGHLKVEKPDNFTNAFEGTSRNGYQIGTALLNVIFAYNGYDNINAVLSEVKNPQRTLRIALPVSMATLGILYTLTNIAYFAAVSKEDLLKSNVTVAATLFKNMFGNTAATKVLPALIALSALGHLLGIAFTIPRVIQELSKAGVMPLCNILMLNRPFRTPLPALTLHFLISVLFICAPPAGDAFNFVVSLGTYPTTVMLTAVTVGLTKIRLTESRETFDSPFRVPWAIIGFYMCGNTFLIVMPFVRPPGGKGSSGLPYWLSSIVALGVLGLGIVYYVLRWVVGPRVGRYRLVKVEKELSDGGMVTRYKRVKNGDREEE